jgi:hypothetical protein
MARSEGVRGCTWRGAGHSGGGQGWLSGARVCPPRRQASGVSVVLAAVRRLARPATGRVEHQCRHGAVPYRPSPVSTTAHGGVENTPPRTTINCFLPLLAGWPPPAPLFAWIILFSEARLRLEQCDAGFPVCAPFLFRGAPAQGCSLFLC